MRILNAEVEGFEARDKPRFRVAASGQAVQVGMLPVDNGLRPQLLMRTFCRVASRFFVTFPELSGKPNGNSLSFSLCSA